MIRFEQLLNKMYLMKDSFITLDEKQFRLVHKTGLDMLIVINDICNKHNLSMMLGFGSALGAVRHKGFVPWDDDIDILIPRKDYDYFIKECVKELPSNMVTYAPGTMNGPEVRYAKIINTDVKIFPQGGNERSNYVCIDIFPLEYYEINSLKRKLKWYSYVLVSTAATTTRLWQDRHLDTDYRFTMIQSKRGKFEYYLRLALGFFFSFFSYKKWLVIADGWYKNSKESNLLFIPSIFLNKPIDKDIMLPVSLGEFEGVSVNLPNKVVDYLIFQYGDWQTLPPEEKRRQHLYYRKKQS